MKRLGRYLLVAGLVLVALSCGKRGRVIPAGTFAEIYADMFLADQWLSDHSTSRPTADTTEFYGAVFARYGYRFADYDKSVNHYLSDPEKYTKILEESVKILDDKQAALKHIQDLQDALRSQEAYLAEFALRPVDFERDTILWVPDTLRTVDSLRIAADSLQRDSLVRDSLRKDSLAKKEAGRVLDSIKTQQSNVKRRNSFRPNSVPQIRDVSGDKPLTLER